MTWKGSIFQTVLFGKVFRSCLERRFRFMCQNSTIESLWCRTLCFVLELVVNKVDMVLPGAKS